MQGKQKVVYISTWGDPSLWQEVVYINEDKKSNMKVYSKKSFTSIATYPSNYDKLLLIVQDSILIPQGWDNNCRRYRNDAVDICMRSNNNNNIFISNILKSLHYGNWVNSVKRYVSCVIGKIDTNNNKIDMNRVRVIVIPSIGKFSGYLNKDQVIYNFGLLKEKGNTISLPLSYIESLLAYNIYEEIKKLDLNEDTKLTIKLDITHGINYLASLALEITRELASLLNLEMKVINYIPTEYQKTYTYKESLSFGNTKFDISKIKINNNIIEDCEKALILSLQMGAILPILYICKNCKRKKRDYNKIFNEKTKIYKEGSNNSLSIVVNGPINELSNSNIVWSDIIYDYVCEKVKNIKDQNGYYSLEDVEGLKNSFSNFFSETTITIIENEINKMRNYKQNYCKGGNNENKRAQDSENSTKGRKENGKDTSPPNRRHFIAHAGFFCGIVEVKEQNGKLLVGYRFREPNCYNVLREVYGFDISQFFV